jgi:hypothetical protein
VLCSPLPGFTNGHFACVGVCVFVCVGVCVCVCRCVALTVGSDRDGVCAGVQGGEAPHTYVYNAISFCAMLCGAVAVLRNAT